MEQKLKNKILEALQTDRVISVINSQKFYFQKAKDVLSEFLQIAISDETKTFLIANKKEYNELKNLFETTEELSEFGRLIFSLIAYCDSNAYRKIDLNDYSDKRVLALAFVRMNNWVEQLILYKFENQLTDGSIKNAIQYLLNPDDNFTMLSENHRSQISENLFKKPYNKETFKDSFLNFFSEFSINITNNENYTYALSCIAYYVSSEWKESIIGLVSPDGTGWQDEAVEESKNGKYVALWNHRKPNGTTKTLKLLRQCIEENDFFKIFYTSNHNALYVAEIVDFVTNQNELNKAQWDKNYNGFAWDGKTFAGYKNKNDEKSARWVYMARKIYKIEPIHASNFVYYNNYGYPSVGCQAPIVSILSNSEIKNQRQMNTNLNVLNYKKQIILQGPPGTGKTREAKLIATEMLGISSVEELNNNIQFKLIQFHPSYTYEDFVRGIVAQSKGDQIEYKNVDKTLGLFAKEALKNLRNSKKVPELISKENWVEENYLKFKEDLEQQLQEGGEIIIKDKTKPKITAIEEDALRVNRYSNEKDSILVKDTDVIEGYIGLNLTNPSIKVKENGLLSKSARSGMYYLYQNLIEKFSQFLKSKNKEFKLTEDLKPEALKKFILVIDEINRANLSSVLGELIYALEYRGEAVESMYAVDDETKLILPPNLFIIGTMNTADRSVGHIDYAIRRRFAFINVLPNDSVIENTAAKVLFEEISNLFESKDTLASDFKKEHVQLGHSYFIVKDNEELNMRAKYEIVPILEEYLKDGILLEKAEKTILELKERFGD
ncbi:AAA family ATPase [Flavobacterium sp.]|uniref:AAA family ATPase n=1 Tax=Flavobacterium sp. TaxID=239 RepID=UPI00262F3D06|nr:AAA family ATPase [Flavobacterium sp.]